MQAFEARFNVDIFKDKMVLFQFLVLLFCMPLGAYIDSPYVAADISYNQIINNILVGLFAASIYWVSESKLRTKMWLMLVMSILAEILGTFILKLYTYRLHNIPVYVPITHVTFYALMAHVKKWPIIRRYSQWIKWSLFGFVTILSGFYFIYFNDTGGLVCYVILVAILFTRTCKLYYLLTSLLGLYAERCGTLAQTWAWASHFDIGTYRMMIGNPPMGVMGLYALLDLIANNAYFWGVLMGRKPRNSNAFCAKYKYLRCLGIELSIQCIQHLCTTFFTIDGYLVWCIQDRMIYEWLNCIIYLKDKPMKKKRTDGNAVNVKLQITALAHQFLALIDAVLLAIFGRWGYQSYVRLNATKPLPIPLDSIDDVLDYIASLRASVNHSLDRIEKELRKNQPAQSMRSRNMNLSEELL